MASYNNPFGISNDDKAIVNGEEDSSFAGIKNKAWKTELVGAASYSGRSPSAFEFGGRSYVTTRGGSGMWGTSPVVHSGIQVHEQTANLASIGVTEEESGSREVLRDAGDKVSGDDILPKATAKYTHEYARPSSVRISRPLNAYAGSDDIGYDGAPDALQPLLISQNAPVFPKDTDIRYMGTDLENRISTKSNEREESKLNSRGNVAAIFRLLPSVFLGTLLNILDGLSYGMILFPLGESIFANLAPDGLSMFYVSCIVSQLVYSLGGSAFGAGIGSEMIEVTPFFHTMALSILSEIGDPENNQAEILSTTVVTYAILSILTGLIFFVLGKLRLGVLVGFFPRHILVGCIGGVGYFLVVTGLEVSARLQGGMSLDNLKMLFENYESFLRWFVPVAITLILVLLQDRIHNSLLIPTYFMFVFFLFHLIIILVPSWNLEGARKQGWLFPAVDDDRPWYNFYNLYKLELVDWWCVLRQVPTMFALTFFGILHVPINVPALAVSLGMDNVDVDRELVAHGYSNVLSGLVGSIQNYLVYTNSVLFIRAGASSRLAGVLLAIATAGVMVTGPVVIGFIPVCVVGSLIFLLGFELLKEALYNTWGRLKNLEYLTILTIVVVMGAWDFVYGVLTGILLASLLFVVDAARKPVVRGIYTGAVARSTVLRHPKQQEFLKDVGNQICVIKLEGTLFFGSIGGVENVIRDIVSEDKYRSFSTKFLILDMRGVVSIDFSAAEGFRRIFNLMNENEIQLITSSVKEEDETVKSLRDAGLWESESYLPVQLFSALNYALEWCENSFLRTYGKVITNPSALTVTRNKSGDSLSNKHLMSSAYEGAFGTPRTNQVYQAAARSATDEQNLQSKFYSSSDQSFRKQPLGLIMTTFLGLSLKDTSFWLRLTPFLIKEHIPADYTFYSAAVDPPSFFIVASGLIRSVFKFETDFREMHSSILPMTAFGDLHPKDTNFRNVVYSTVTDSVTWRLSQKKMEDLLKSPDGEAIYTELLKIQVKLVKERFDTMTANLVISA